MKKRISLKAAQRIKNKQDDAEKKELVIDDNEKMLIDNINQNAEEDDENKNENNSNRTVIVKNLSLITIESDLEKFITALSPDFDINEIRLVRDRKGNSKGIAFIDLPTIEQAHDCAILLNNKQLDDNIITCAVSKPPNLGENDSRTIFVNNISYESTQNEIKSAFEQYGQILDVRLIYDKNNNRPKGYCYVEFADENSVQKVLNDKYNFVIEGRKVIIKPSESVTKLREKIKYVAHITNLPFSLTESKIKEFFIEHDVDKINDILISRDDQGNSKGFGFVEFNNSESLLKAIQLTGKLIRGRPVCIKESKRNITRSKKRKASQDIEKEILPNKKMKVSENSKTGLSNKDFRQYLK